MDLDSYLDRHYAVIMERNDENKITITPEYIESHRSELEEMVRIFTLYPDYLIDLITPKNSYFHLFFYQRIFLRVCMRFQEVNGVFTRAFSKSFLNYISSVIKSIMRPNNKSFICAETKSQAAKIAQEKTEEIFRLFPFLVNELAISDIDKQNKKYGNTGSDYCELYFKNGAEMDVLHAGNSTRGGRRNCGTLEEYAFVDGDAVNETILPLLNIDRRTVNGQLNETEPHAQQVWITTAGYKGTYAHNKALECLVKSALDPEKHFCFGGDYRIPVKHGLITVDKVKDKLHSSSYKLESFLREYVSVWTGGSEDSYYSYSLIDKCRTLVRPEFSAKEAHKGFYVAAVDVARFEGDQTVIMIFKVYTTPSESGDRWKVAVVNMKLLNGTHFKEQAKMIKKFDIDYNFRAIVMDINGNGAGLADYMIDEQMEPDGYYRPYGFINKTKYFSTEKRGCERKLYGIEANRQLNNQVYTNAHIYLSLKRVSLLLNEQQARRFFSKYVSWRKLKPDEQAVRLIPYVQTTKLQDQLANLKAIIDTSGMITIQKINSHIRKDLVSAFCYGLYYINEMEEEERKRGNRNYSKAQFCFLN